MGDVEQPQLGRQVEAVARLRLHGRDPVAQHLVEPASTVAVQLLGRGGPRGGNRREDPAAGGQDVEIGRSAPAELQLALAAPGEEEMGVGIDQARRDRAAVGVQDREPIEVAPVGLQDQPDLRLAADAQHHPVGDRDHHIRVGPPVDLALRGAHPRAAAHRDDLSRVDDEEPGRILLVQTPRENSECHVARCRAAVIDARRFRRRPGAARGPAAG